MVPVVKWRETADNRLCGVAKVINLCRSSDVACSICRRGKTGIILSRAVVVKRLSRCRANGRDPWGNPEKYGVETTVYMT